MSPTTITRVFILGASDTDFASVAQSLAAAGLSAMYRVMAPGDLGQLARGISEMTQQCNAICLADGWWSAREALCMQMVASWLQYKVYDAKGGKMPTMGLSGESNVSTIEGING